MIGDYISTSIIPSDGLVLPVFALANLPHGSTLHEATNATPRGMVAGEAVRVQPLEGVAPEFAIRLAVAQDVVGEDEDAVGDGNDGLLCRRGA